MTDTTNTADSGAGALAPAEAPKNDTQAAAIEAATPSATPGPAADEAAQQAEEAKQAEEKRKNRTKTYIDRINAENRQMRERLSALEAAQQPQAQAAVPQNTDRGPQLEDFDYDMTAWQTARDAWVLDQAEKRITEKNQKAQEQSRQQEIVTSYTQKADEFAETHPDFDEVVGSIQYPLHPALQAAIQAHPRGPEIAYHLGLNDDDAFDLASRQPHLAAAAVERLAARLSAAPAAASNPTAPALATTPPPVARPLSKAPPPPPTVGGRSPTDTPAEKLTDDEWFKRERERQRKR